MNRIEVIERCLDNTKPIEDRENQGLLWFGKHFFPHVIRNKYSMAHYKMSHLFFEMLHPSRATAMDRQSYMLIHREAAKSTVATFLMPMYLIFLKGYAPVYKRMKEGWEGGTGINNFDIIQLPKLDEKFILIASETSGQSEAFVTDIKTEIETNKYLKNTFGSKDPIDIEGEDFVRAKSTKWTKTAFITKDKTAVWGIGSGQRVRGRKINGSRPTFIIVDDMYSEENTKTAERREALSKWFYNALKNSLDSQKGKIIWLGTMVHPDIIYKDFEKDTNWIGLKVPIIGEKELSIALDKCETDENGKLCLPSDEDIEEMNRTFTTLSWKDRYPVDYVLKKYIEQLTKEKPDYFYQEYMNKPISPNSETIDPKAFERYSNLRFYISDRGEQRCEFKDKDGVKWDGEVILKAGVDMASAVHKKADDTVIIVAGMCRFYPHFPGMDSYLSKTKYPQGMVLPVIAHVEGGKFDILSLSNSGTRKDIANILLDLSKRFKLDRISIEANGQQEMSIRAIHGYLRESNCPAMVEPHYVSQEKSERIKATLLPIFQKYKRIICVDDMQIQTLYQQMNMLTISDRDDYPDALEKALVNARIPTEYRPVIESSQEEEIERDLGKYAWYFL